MKPYSLLIVDDEERFANMLAMRLNLRGCDCEVCYNGQDAIDIIQEKIFDLVLLDLRLPDIYGTDVLAGIKEINAKIPVIIVTAHGTEKDRQLCIQLGAYAFMHKPLNIEELTPIFKKLRELSE